MSEVAKVAHDWERIEADYRAGVLSVREIAASQCITHGAIQKRAKRDGWTRDLSKKIQAKADALVATKQVAAQVATAKAATEKGIVEANAEAIARIRMTHRGDIARARTLSMSLLEELEIETGSIDLFHELGEMLYAPDAKGKDKRNEIYMKVISSAGRVDSMKKLAETLKALVALEREAYGLTSEPHKVEVTGAEGGPIQTENMTTERFREIATAIADEV